MKDYKVVMANRGTREETVVALNNKVQQLIKKGWEPLGAVIVDTSSSVSVFMFQTMILKD